MKAFNLLSALVIASVEATWFTYDSTTCGVTPPNAVLPNSRAQQDYAEAYALVQAGLSCVNNYPVDLVARETLTTYFGILPNAQFSAPNSDGISALDKIEASLEAVKAWLDGQLPAYLSPEQPLLYCSSQWLQYYPWNIQALDKSGTPRIKVGVDGATSIVTWEQAFPQEFSEGLSLYWSDQFKQVYFLDTGGGDYCSIDENFGLTQTDTTKPPPFTIICPSAYTDPEHIPNLGGTGRPTIGTGLDTYLPYSATFYHEMFHLAVSNADTPDLEMDLAEIIDEAKDAASGNDVAMNDLASDPETFVFMSLDYWYYLQQYPTDPSQPVGPSNVLPRISFKTGLAQEV